MNGNNTHSVPDAAAQAGAEQRYRAVLNATGTTVFVYDVATRTYRVDLQAHPSTAGAFSGAALGDELVNKGILDTDTVTALQAAIAEVSTGSVPMAERTVQLKTREGTMRWYRVRVLPMEDESCEGKLLITANDVNEQVETTAALRARAERDALTGVYSRDAFFERAAELIGTHEPGYYVMACFNIENFKVINDQYGSEKGDHVLRYIASVFKRGFSAIGGICCRVMADNFAVLYPCAYMESGRVAAIRDAAARLDGTVTPITFSIGRYIVSDTSLHPSAMYDRAAIAENSVKRRYDVHIARYSESMREHILREQEIINDMNTALETGCFEMWLQPQYNHATGALVGAEALARWRHPIRGLIAPAEFVPVFERNGFVYELDKVIWEQACRWLRRWLDEGRDPLPLAVNVSRYDVFRDDFIETLTGLQHKYAVPVDLLRLEITESAFARSSEQIIGVIKQLTARGFIVEIDDFGSGYSSFNTLKDVPANILKLDMRFLEDNGNSTRGGNILESIVRMAKWLGMPVIAEGVETLAQADYLKSIGCNYVQGYLYGRPMQLEQFEALAASAEKEPHLRALRTVANMDNDTFWDPNSMDTLIFNSFVGGACIFECCNGRIELLRANDKYAQVIGSAGMTIADALKLDWTEHLDEDNRARFLKALQRSIDTGDEVGDEYCFLDLPGCPRETYLRSSLRVIAAAGDHYLVYCMNENITAQRTAERKRQESSEQLRFLNDTARDLLSSRDSDSAIDAVLNKILTYFDGNRAYIIEIEPSSQLSSNTYEVCAPGVTSEKEMLQNIPLDAVPFWQRAFDEYEYIDIPDVDALDDSRTVERELLNSQGIRSLVAVPLRRDDALIGFVGVDDPRFQQAHIDELKAIGDYLAVMLTRRDLNARIESDRETLSHMMNDMPGGFVRMRATADGSLMTEYVNDGFCRLRGMTREQIFAEDSGDSLRSIHPDDVQSVRTAVQEMVANDQTRTVKYRLRRGDGSYVWLLVFGRTSRSETGEVYINAYFSDLSDQERRELTARETVPFILLAMMESTTDLSFAKDKDLRYICCSRLFAQMAGLSNAADVVGKTDYDLFDREIADKYRKDDRDMMENGRALVDMVEEIPSEDGVPHYSSTSKYLLHDTAGSVIGLYGTGRDITQYRESFARLKLLTDNIPGGIAMYELSADTLRLLYFSDGFYAHTGYTRDEYRRLTDENPMALTFAEDMPALREQMRRLLAGGTLLDTTYRTRGKDGSCRWLNLRGNVSERRGTTLIVNAVKFDVTEQRLTEENLHIREQEYRLAIVNAGKLIYRYSHRDNAIDMPEDTAALLGLATRIENMPDGVLKTGAIAPESVDAFIAFFQAMRRGDRTGGMTVRRCISGGTLRWFSARFSNIYDDEGKPVSAIVVFEDITEQREEDEKTELLRQNERMFRTVAAHSNRSIFRYDLTTRTATLFSAADGDSLILPDLPESRIREGVVLPDSADDYRRVFAQIHAGTADGGAKLHVRRNDGTLGWWDMRYSLFYDDRHVPVLAVLSFLDITDEHEKELAYERYRQSIIESASPESLVYFETDLTADTVEREGGNVSYVQFPACGCRHQDAVDYGINTLLAEREHGRARVFFQRERLLREFFAGVRTLAEDWPAVLPDGTDVWFRSDVELIQDPYSGHIRAYIILRDITEETRAALDVKKQAETDGMTGLYNKTTTETLIRQVLSRPDHTPCALLIMDLDNLKAINDSMGHEQGDIALRRLSDTLRAQFRHTDIIGRVGGDEFVVFLDGGGSETRIRSMLLSFMRRLTEQRIGPNGDAALHASIGAVIGMAGQDTYETLFRQADRALYHVKRNGKNDFAIYTPEMDRTEYRYEGHTVDTLWRSSLLDSAELDHLLRALSEVYPLVISVNLTRDSYYMMQYDRYMTRSCVNSGAFSDLIAQGAKTFHRDDRASFLAAFSRDKLLAAHRRGEKTVSHIGRQRGDDGVYRRIHTEVIFVDGENGDVLEITLSREYDSIPNTPGEKNGGKT